MTFEYIPPTWDYGWACLIDEDFSGNLKLRQKQCDNCVCEWVIVQRSAGKLAKQEIANNVP